MVIFSIILYVSFILPQINKCFTADELQWVTSGTGLALGKPVFLYSPPLYGWLISIPIKIFGPNHISIRLVGVLSVMVSFLLIYLIVKFICKNNKNLNFITFLAMFIYGTHPMVVQGSLIADIDNTVMTPIFLLVIYSLLRLGTGNRLLFLAVFSFALFIWVKLTTFILFMSILLFVSVYRKNRENIRDLLRVFIYAVIIFAGSWFAISKITNLNYMQPVLYLKHRIGLDLFGPLKDIKLLFANIIYLSIWFSPYLLLSVFIILARHIVLIIKKKEQCRYYLAIAAISILLYIPITQIALGFPKYYVPLIAIASIMIAIDIPLILDKVGYKKIWFLFVILLLLTAYFYFIPGDIIYGVRYNLKKMFAIAGIDRSSVLLKVVRQYLLYFAPMPFVWLMMRYVLKTWTKTFYLAIIILGVSSCLSMSLTQAMVSYNTNYSYGERGMRDVINFLKKEAFPEDKIVGNSHILYYLGRYDYSQALKKETLTDKDIFLETVSDNSVRFVLYSVTSNQVQSYKNVFNNENVLRYLNSNFSHMQIGDFEVWVRKK